MTENGIQAENNIQATKRFIDQVVLTDGSKWGTEEITDLRNKFTELQAAHEARAKRLIDANQKYVNLAAEVRNSFQELVDDGDLDVEKANEVLEHLGLDPLHTEWEWEATVTIRGYAKATSDDELSSAIESADFQVEVWGNSEVTDVEVQDVDVNEVRSDRVTR